MAGLPLYSDISLTEIFFPTLNRRFRLPDGPRLESSFLVVSSEHGPKANGSATSQFGIAQIEDPRSSMTFHNIYDIHRLVVEIDQINLLNEAKFAVDKHMNTLFVRLTSCGSAEEDVAQKSNRHRVDADTNYHKHSLAGGCVTT